MSMDAGAEGAALDGRMPILPNERIFVSFIPFLWTCTILGSAIWVFLIGGALASIGDIRITIPGLLIGLVIGMLPPILSAGFPSFRYGVDTTDATKAVFGSRGTFISLIGLLYVVCAWQSVVTAFIAKGAATVVARSSAFGFSRPLEVGIALAVVVVAWTIVWLGPKVLERVNNVVAPVLLLLALVMLILLAVRVGPASLWTGAAPKSGRMSMDTHLTFMTAIEFGVGVSFGNWPFTGGLLRLARYRRHVVTAPMLGMGFIGVGFGAAVSAMTAVALPGDDPVNWILELGGRGLGGTVVIAILVGNIAVVGMLSYFAGIAVQQIKLIGRLPWSAIIALMLLPSIVAAFNIDATLSAVIQIANYQGMLMVGIASVCSADYFLLRKQQIDVAQLFVAGAAGRYWFWHGINWIAVGGVIASASVYRMLYDPATIASTPAFRYLGASIPAYIVGAALYTAVTLLAQRFTTVGGYRRTNTAEVANVSL
jgi:nucleobase:cation symporter-1, NCS1 family